MAVITISRGSASGGLRLAEGLAKLLDYELLSREDIFRAALEFGGLEEKLRKALLNPPGFWERFKHERRRYLVLVQAALCARVQKDRVIYYGNAGHLLLRGVSHVLCIRLIAPMSFRVQTLMERDDMRRDRAIEHIEEVDQQRRDWTRFLYGVDWMDPALYDLTINLKTLDIDGAVELAATAARRKEFQPTEASAKVLDNLALASKVQAALATTEETESVDLEVDAEDGTVFLKGKLRTASLVEATIRVAENVEGVQGVDREHLDAPEFTV
jgi:cytidylate kinase